MDQNPYESPREWEPAAAGELPEYDAGLVERVRQLVAKKTDTRLRKISPGTSLAFDIRINGDEVTDLFEAFTREFNVDPQSLPPFDFGGLFLSEHEILQTTARAGYGCLGVLAAMTLSGVVAVLAFPWGAALFVIPMLGLIWLFYLSSGWRKIRRGDPEDVIVGDLVDAAMAGRWVKQPRGELYRKPE